MHAHAHARNNYAGASRLKVSWFKAEASIHGIAHYLEKGSQLTNPYKTYNTYPIQDIQYIYTQEQKDNGNWELWVYMYSI